MMKIQTQRIIKDRVKTLVNAAKDNAWKNTGHDRNKKLWLTIKKAKRWYFRQRWIFIDREKKH